MSRFCYCHTSGDICCFSSRVVVFLVAIAVCCCRCALVLVEKYPHDLLTIFDAERFLWLLSSPSLVLMSSCLRTFFVGQEARLAADADPAICRHTHKKKNAEITRTVIVSRLRLSVSARSSLSPPCRFSSMSCPAWKWARRRRCPTCLRTWCP